MEAHEEGSRANERQHNETRDPAEVEAQGPQKRSERVAWVEDRSAEQPQLCTDDDGLVDRYSNRREKRHRKETRSRR